MFLLQACGFLVDGMDSEKDVFAYLPEDEELNSLMSALALLGHKFEDASPVKEHKPLPYQDLGSANTSRQASQTARACDRETVVISLFLLLAI